MTPYTYGVLFTDLQVWNEDFSADFIAALPGIIQKGEQRILRDLDLDNLDYSVTTGAISQTTALVAKPTMLIRERDVVLQNATPAPLSVLLKRSYGFVLEYMIANGAAVAPPKYYAENDPTHWIVAPTPDAAYTLAVRGIYPPALIGDNDQQNSPEFVAVFQNTVADTPLTETDDLAYPPFAAGASLTGTNAPVTMVTGGNVVGAQVGLFSTGNMSANTFVVVGEDMNGNSLTSVIAGPNAGVVFTPEFFTIVTSIVPSLTDNVNQVAAGLYSSNSSWVASRFPDLLFYSCMVDACQFLKRFSARAVAQNEYAGRLSDVQTQVRLLKRSDLDDLFVSRQLINGPGMGPPEMPPSAPAAQQPTPGAQ